MVEEAKEASSKPAEIKPSDLRPGAYYFELIEARYPKTGKESHFLYWWDKDKQKLVLEEVNEGGMRTDSAPLIKNDAKTLPIAKSKISEDIDNQKERGIEIIRNQDINSELFKEAKISRGMLTPYFEELIEDRQLLIDEAWQYFNDASARVKRAENDVEKGKIYRKSVFGPSAKLKMEKQKNNLKFAIDGKIKAFRFFNQYLNERIGVDEPAESYDETYETYVSYNRQLADLAHLTQTNDLEEKDRILKEYEDIFSKRLALHHKIAEQRSYIPVKGIPDEFPIAKKSEVKAESKRKEPASKKTDEKSKKILTKKGKDSESESLIESLEARLEDLDKQASSALYGRLNDERKKVEEKLNALRKKGADKVGPDKSDNGRESSVEKESDIEDIKVPVEGKQPEPEKVEVETPKPPSTEEEKPFFDQVADEIKRNGSVERNLGSEDLQKLFQGIIEGLLSTRQDINADLELKEPVISVGEGNIMATVNLQSPIKATIDINISLANADQPGKLRLKNLKINEKSGLAAKLALKAVNLQGRARAILEDPNESLLNGMNSELESKGVRLSDVRLEFEDNILRVSASGERNEEI